MYLIEIDAEATDGEDAEEVAVVGDDDDVESADDGAMIEGTSAHELR
jgi:hypothetical protein